MAAHGTEAAGPRAVAPPPVWPRRLTSPPPFRHDGMPRSFPSNDTIAPEGRPHAQEGDGRRDEREGGGAQLLHRVSRWRDAAPRRADPTRCSFHRVVRPCSASAASERHQLYWANEQASTLAFRSRSAHLTVVCGASLSACRGSVAERVSYITCRSWRKDASRIRSRGSTSTRSPGRSKR